MGRCQLGIIKYAAKVWNHTFYRNARPKYVESFWNLVNWDFVAKNQGG